MFKLSFRKVCGLFLILFVTGSLVAGCYDDSELRASIEDLKTQLGQLTKLVNNLQSDDSVTGVTQNPDGSYTINFKKSGSVTIKNGKDGQDGQNGQDGQDGSIVNVVKGPDTYTFIFNDGTTVILPRYSEIRVLTFEDGDYVGPIKMANYWSSKIDEPQYGGPILYGDGCRWEDEYNTYLCGLVTPYDADTWSGGFSGGGIAISNYGGGNLKEAGYKVQLERYVPGLENEVRMGVGNNASDNFAVVYDGGAWGNNPPALTMKDGEPRVILSAFITNTSYTLNSLVNGDGYNPPMAKDGFFKIVATGYVGEEETGTAEFFLARGELNFVTTWTKWDLSGLGAVDKVVFSLVGSKDQYGTYGLNTPAYFAIDDISVRYYPD